MLKWGPDFATCLPILPLPPQPRVGPGPLVKDAQGLIRYGVYGSPAICCWREPIVSRILGRN
jgi:hypothetical protein